MTNSVKDSLETGEQWQHIGNASTIYILETSPYGDSPHGEGILLKKHAYCVQFLTDDGLRKVMDSKEFLKLYRHVPHMRGAYK